ncbi:SAG-related sequence SRS60A [Toxoplasma gondii p89]|uniref:SAG-related sequence SRS60A n=1 Tax=Toxoplasma gondii p89 TaxID=943119 RepID=A0A086JGY0_TOXGO|nr:SAG-related sequence SRS60A [Toxoplasma gondii p89]
MARVCRVAVGVRQQLAASVVAGLLVTLLTDVDASPVNALPPDRADSTVPTCDEGQEMTITLSPEKNAASFMCGTAIGNISPPLRPAKEGFEAFVDEAATTVVRFHSPDVQLIEENNVYTVTAGIFPPVGGTWYLFCLEPGIGSAAVNTVKKKCRVEVVIKGTSIIPQQCTTVGGSVDLRIRGPGYAVTFGCGLSFPQLDPPLSGKEVYVGRECSEKQQLSALVPSAALEVGPAGQLYTLFVDKLPPVGRLLCYKCVNDLTAACKALIAVPPSAEEVATTVASTSTFGPSSDATIALHSSSSYLLIAVVFLLRLM